jgi:hypothetical protein
VNKSFKKSDFPTYVKLKIGSGSGRRYTTVLKMTIRNKWYWTWRGPFLIERLAAVSGRPLVVAEPGSSPALAVAEVEGSRLFASTGFDTGRTALGPELLPVDEEKLLKKNSSTRVIQIREER